MIQPTDDTAPAAPGYDGWAIIDLASQTVIRVNPHGRELLGSFAANLPSLVEANHGRTEPDTSNDTILSGVRAGSTWSGWIRLNERSDDDAVLLPAMIVPHVAPGVGPAELASLLFGLRSTGSATEVAIDPLTGLATRAALLEHLERAVQANRKNSKLLVVLFVDLDGLKGINDRYGHEVGDDALIDSARRLAANLPSNAAIVRFGGDEFVVVYENADELDDAEHLAKRLLDALRHGTDFLTVSASIGIAAGRAGEVAPRELIRRADAAMYQAKARGGAQIAIFDDEMHTRQLDDERSRTLLVQAIAQNGFQVVAQPIFELATGRIVGVELVVRVSADGLDFADSPDLFRLTHEQRETFDVALFDRAMQLAQQWGADHGAGAPRIHFKLSSQSLTSPDFARRVATRLTTGGARAALLAFEIDGQDLIAAERNRSSIADVRALGAALVVDGLGAGALTLAALANLSPAMIKLALCDHSRPVLTALMRAASTLRIPTCVSGIDHRAALRHAVDIGAFAGQGEALVPVGQIDHLDAQLRNRHRIGF